MTDFTIDELITVAENCADKLLLATVVMTDARKQEIQKFRAIAEALKAQQDIKYQIDVLETAEESEEYLKGFEECRECIAEMFVPWPQPPKENSGE